MKIQSIQQFNKSIWANQISWKSNQSNNSTNPTEPIKFHENTINPTIKKSIWGNQVSWKSNQYNNLTNPSEPIKFHENPINPTIQQIHLSQSSFMKIQSIQQFNKSIWGNKISWKSNQTNNLTNPSEPIKFHENPINPTIQQKHLSQSNFMKIQSIQQFNKSNWAN